jgi:hypothetical protein
MSFFGFKKKGEIIDLTEKYRKEENSETENSDSFSILGNSNNSSSSEDTVFSGTPEHNRRKLAKRLINISNKLDEISTQIYHLQQRVELLERKTGVKIGQ